MTQQLEMNTCSCGCGKSTQSKYAHGHHPNSRLPSVETRVRISESLKGHPSWSFGMVRTDSPTVQTVHGRLNRDHPRTGTCEECGKEGKTAYAFQRHPEPYTEDIQDYRELCASCHTTFDGTIANFRGI